MATARALRKRMTPQEVKLWNWLRESVVPIGFHFRRQVPVDRFIVDFACLRAKLIVEVDGEQHGLVEGRRRDAVRDQRLLELGFEVVRFSNREVDREKPMVLDTIVARLHESQRLHPTPVGFADSPSPGGEGSLGGVQDA